MKYAKLLSATSIDTNPPRSAMIGGRFVCGRLPEPYLNSLGYYRLDETAEAGTPDEGYHLEPRYNYDDAEHQTKVVRTFVQVADPVPTRPPRTISKFRLKMALANLGLLDQFTEMLSQVEVAPGYMGDEAFRDAVTLDEDNEKFQGAVTLVKQEFGLTDEQIESILAASVSQ